MQCNATQFISQEHDAPQRNTIERRETRDERRETRDERDERRQRRQRRQRRRRRRRRRRDGETETERRSNGMRRYGKERTMRWKSANWRPNFAKIMRSHDSMLTAVCDLVVVGSAIDTALLFS